MFLKRLLRRIRGALGVGTGTLGFVIGGAFSGVLTYAYRNRSFADIKAGRFALLGAVVAAVFFPGSPVMAAMFGALSAGTTIKLAQSAAEPLESGAGQQLLDAPLEEAP